MAEIEVSGECFSHISVKNKGNNDVTVCKSCREYEIQLKEALDELISVRMINKLLQKELLSYATPKSTWGIDLDSTDNNGDSDVNSEWTLVTTKNRIVKLKKRDKSATVKTGQFIKTTNRYTPLTKVLADKEGTIRVNVNGDISTEGSVKVINRKASNEVDSGKGETKPKKKKIIIIGDSHARGCAREISNYLSKEYEVSGTVMPGSGLANITALAREEILNLTSDDAVVIWGGSNDVNRNETSLGLKHLENFINHRSSTNIIALAAPHRHDLQETSYINNEVHVFNRKLHKIFKARDNVKILDINPHRNNFTQHGLHLNTIGKEKIAEMIAKNIKQFWVKKKIIPISVDEEGNPKDVWPELHEAITQAEVNRNFTSETVIDERHHSTPMSRRPKSTPVTRHEDFLW